MPEPEQPPVPEEPPMLRAISSRNSTVKVTQMGIVGLENGEQDDEELKVTKKKNNTDEMQLSDTIARSLAKSKNGAGSACAPLTTRNKDIPLARRNP